MGNVTFRGITLDELRSRYNTHVFWYVFDSRADEGHGWRTESDMMERLGYVFTDQSDAETWKRILSRSADFRDNNYMRVDSDTWPEIDVVFAETYGESLWTALNHEEAQKLFSNFPNEQVRLDGLEPYD